MWKTWFEQTDDFNQMSWVLLGQWSGAMMTFVIIVSLLIIFLSWHNSQKLTLIP